ncbi:hypothetical protein HK102_010750, partial [Quaeritorhiza haematococci]
WTLFLHTLNNPAGFEALKKFAVKNFCAENPLFLEQYREVVGVVVREYVERRGTKSRDGGRTRESEHASASSNGGVGTHQQTPIPFGKGLRSYLSTTTTSPTSPATSAPHTTPLSAPASAVTVPSKRIPRTPPCLFPLYQQFYDTFIAEDAVLQVNLPGRVTQRIRKYFQRGAGDGQGEDEVLRMLYLNTFTKFFVFCEKEEVVRVLVEEYQSGFQVQGLR